MSERVVAGVVGAAWAASAALYGVANNGYQDAYDAVETNLTAQEQASGEEFYVLHDEYYDKMDTEKEWGAVRAPAIGIFATTNMVVLACGGAFVYQRLPRRRRSTADITA